MTATGGVRRKTILVVEDDEAVRTLLARALGVQYEVLTACDGQQALDLLQSSRAPAPLSLIITDVMMPKMNGYALSRLLKADRRWNTVPIVFLTARASAKDVVLGISAGARHYISKPFSVRDVIEKVGRILNA
ncbi:response regulator [Pendulispora brunnea]|uniref:Response regulator n=1 Tax=Pendulispora brunnea TaxID=2905690 RepID=A0ABZ2KMK9_9BACT